jgi:hypothetical protein
MAAERRQTAQGTTRADAYTRRVGGNGEQRQIEEIRAWFDERGYDLYVHEIEGHGWRAPFMQKGVRIGSSDYGVGPTALAAAEDARSRHASGSRMVFGHDYGTGADRAVVVKREAPEQTIYPESIVHERAIGEPEVVSRAIETLTTFGWVVMFEDEPDGKVTGHLLDHDSRRILKSTIGDDFEDAWLGLGIGTTAPSAELRREREDRRSDDSTA